MIKYQQISDTEKRRIYQDVSNMHLINFLGFESRTIYLLYLQL